MDSVEAAMELELCLYAVRIRREATSGMGTQWHVRGSTHTSLVSDHNASSKQLQARLTNHLSIIRSYLVVFISSTSSQEYLSARKTKEIQDIEMPDLESNSKSDETSRT